MGCCPDRAGTRPRPRSSLATRSSPATGRWRPTRTSPTCACRPARRSGPPSTSRRSPPTSGRRASEVVSVLVRPKDRKVKFDKDDDRLSVKAYEAAKKKAFEDAQQQPTGTPPAAPTSTPQIPDAVAAELAELGINAGAPMQVFTADSAQGQAALAAFTQHRRRTGRADALSLGSAQAPGAARARAAHRRRVRRAAAPHPRQLTRATSVSSSGSAVQVPQVRPGGSPSLRGRLTHVDRRVLGLLVRDAVAVVDRGYPVTLLQQPRRATLGDGDDGGVPLRRWTPVPEAVVAAVRSGQTVLRPVTGRWRRPRRSCWSRIVVRARCDAGSASYVSATWSTRSGHPTARTVSAGPRYALL